MEESINGRKFKLIPSHVNQCKPTEDTLLSLFTFVYFKLTARKGGDIVSTQEGGGAGGTGRLCISGCEGRAPISSSTILASGGL
eukprot:scaffold3744_cov63-Cyclotella_meneghiniana.AAC.7